ncbi:DUF1990 family protein [Pedococcus sp. NPDC057267]|uniref:DUF1990 family protein n=1 Tax=Pedococcus sp. NPDC057267 TaxID=3346077 RepID=UPI003643FF3B
MGHGHQPDPTPPPRGAPGRAPDVCRRGGQRLGVAAGRLPGRAGGARPGAAGPRRAAEDLLAWRVHQRAGLRVAASGPAVPGAVVDMRLGPGPLSVRIPCRVVSVVDEPDRGGFAYGTLPGHPESGEELFLLHSGADGRITFTITAFSRPATALARLGGPLGTLVQDVMTRRYLAALDRVAR